MDLWVPISSVGTVAAAGIAAVAAFIARSSARASNAAATKLAAIEGQRRHLELCPRLRVTCKPFGPGVDDTVRLRIMLLGPPGLDRVDRLTITIRNDYFRRGDCHQQVLDGPTQEEIQQHIWGPYRFLAGPDEAVPDRAGRMVAYNVSIPVGEELPYELRHTLPGRWMDNMSQSDWLRQRGTVIRLGVTAEHKEHGTWYLPCEIDTATMPMEIFVPQYDNRAQHC